MRFQTEALPNFPVETRLAAQKTGRSPSYIRTTPASNQAGIFFVPAFDEVPMPTTWANTPLDVFLSAAWTSRSEVHAESKDPYTLLRCKHASASRHRLICETSSASARSFPASSSKMSSWHRFSLRLVFADST